MRVDDVGSNLVHDINVDILSYSKVLNAVAKCKADLAKATLHTVVKHVDDIPLHLELLGRVLCNKKTAFETHRLLCVQKTYVKLEHLRKDGDRNIHHQLLNFP
jgi:hypothetical protein